MEMWVKVLHSICIMGTRGLPDMYTLGPRGVHIRQTTRARVTNTKYIPSHRNVFTLVSLM